MGYPEKDPKDSSNPSEPVEATPKKESGPQLNAILPDDLPPAAAELVGDIDNYQKRMEKEWEKAKVSYEHKINRIMEEFLHAGMVGLAADQEAAAQNEKPSKKFTPPPDPEVTPKHASSRDARLARLISEIEQELKEASRKNKRVSFLPNNAPDMLQLPWVGGAPKFWKDPRKIIPAAALLLVGSYFFFSSWFVQVTPLPYAHSLGPVVWKDNICILDWFRKAIYVHVDKPWLPIKSVEFVPNSLATGLAYSEKTIWTLEGFERKILLHAVTPDHQISSSVSSPDSKPAGLFYDGTDLWSADQDSKKLYRHRGNDVEDIRDTFPLPDITVTAFAFRENRLWLLDGKSRLVNVYRLQKPMLLLASFDLDPFVKGATPTGMTFLGKKLLVVTENPPTLTRIPLLRLKKSKTESF